MFKGEINQQVVNGVAFSNTNGSGFQSGVGFDSNGGSGSVGVGADVHVFDVLTDGVRRVGLLVDVVRAVHAIRAAFRGGSAVVFPYAAVRMLQPIVGTQAVGSSFMYYAVEGTSGVTVRSYADSRMFNGDMHLFMDDQQLCLALFDCHDVALGAEDHVSGGGVSDGDLAALIGSVTI